MSLLAQIADTLLAVRTPPQYLYVQRQLFTALMAELEKSSGKAAVTQFTATDKLFGLHVVWVQCTAHPDVRAI